jgi:hypothetical protein
MGKFKRIDLSKIKTIKFDDRRTKTDLHRFGKPFDPDLSFSDFLKSLPDYLRANDLLTLAEKIARARADGKYVIWMMGAHPLKVGLAPVINDLIQGKFINHLAFNGACAIHDIELAFFGRTSEEVSEGLADGRFGMVEETPRLIFEAAKNASEDSLGLGEGLGKFISEKSPDFADQSVFGTCYDNNVPASVHVAIGTDTISQHPGFDGAIFGKLSNDDFLIFSESISHLTEGVIINVGSAVILPEVFLKALTVARNIYGKIDNFTAANFDMIQHYRPNTNVVIRPVAGKGAGFSFTGHHELMLPLLAAAIKSRYKEISEG